jgi:hypothetical protein
MLVQRRHQAIAQGLAFVLRQDPGMRRRILGRRRDDHLAAIAAGGDPIEGIG